MSEQGSFFAVGKSEWDKACSLGLNPAVALLVMARGTSRDNATTTWSCEAISAHTGITWRRARDAVALLESNGLVGKEKGGARPIRTLKIDMEEGAAIWLPNELVTGAGRETPPVRRLREGRDVDPLRLLIDLYLEQELTGDGGIARTLLRSPFKRELICGWGPFDVFGFKRAESSLANGVGVLSRYWKAKENVVWERVDALIGMGLLERIAYLAEGDDPNAELIHALDGDDHARDVAQAAREFAEALPGGFSYEAAEYEFTLPVMKHMKQAAVVGVYRLRYRPKTKRTAAWYGQHVTSCAEYAEQYRRLAAADFSVAGTSKNRLQGSSKSLKGHKAFGS